MDESRRASVEDGGDDHHETLLGVDEGDRVRVAFADPIEHGGTTHEATTFTVTSIHDPESVRNPSTGQDVRLTVDGFHDADDVDEPGTVEGWRVRAVREGSEWQRPTVRGYDEGRHPELDHESPDHETTEGVAVASVAVVPDDGEAPDVDDGGARNAAGAGDAGPDGEK
jgi:hypothetical protein